MSSSPGLNPEPADPQERKENHLPPKSYVDAAVEEKPSTNGTVNGDEWKRPGYDRQESSHEYSAQVCNATAIELQCLTRCQGIDDTPRTPIKKAHRKASRSTNSLDDEGPKTNGLSTSSSAVCTTYKTYGSRR
jgi:hypothetical protein